MKIIEYGILRLSDEEQLSILGGCAVQVCGANVCGIDVCSVDVCGVDGCGVDIATGCGANLSPTVTASEKATK